MGSTYVVFHVSPNHVDDCYLCLTPPIKARLSMICHPNAELLGSRLQQWNLLQNDVRVSMYRKRQRDLNPLFIYLFIYCCDINGLMEKFEIGA